VLNPQQRLRSGVVNGKCLLARLAAVTVSPSSFSEFNCFNAAAIGAMAVVFFLALLLNILSLDC
jgi:hypothetical protein